MIEIPLSAIPNQSFSIRLDNHQYDIRIHTANNIMTFDIIRDGLEIVMGIRVVSGYPIIPYEYLENGNFVIITDNDDYPDYTQFGITQFLLYVSEEELGEIRAGT